MSGCVPRPEPDLPAGRDLDGSTVLVCALRKPPWLVTAGPAHPPRPLPARSVVGVPSFPRVAPDGTLAYVTLTGRTDVREWLTALAVVSPSGDLLDLVPGAAPFCPPAWSPDGARLLFARDRPGAAGGLAVAYELASGHEEVLFDDPQLRSLAWDADGGVVYSTTTGVAGWRQGATTELVRHGVADGLRRFGTDDLYVTLDQLAVVGDSAALVLRWNAQGRSAREEVWRVRHGRLVPAVAEPASCPRWGPDGDLAVAMGDAVRLVGTERPATVAATLLAEFDGLHSFDWHSGPEPRPAAADGGPDRFSGPDTRWMPSP
jgi:hypothetical protein